MINAKVSHIYAPPSPLADTQPSSGRLDVRTRNEEDVSGDRFLDSERRGRCRRGQTLDRAILRERPPTDPQFRKRSRTILRCS